MKLKEKKRFWNDFFEKYECLPIRDFEKKQIQDFLKERVSVSILDLGGGLGTLWTSCPDKKISLITTVDISSIALQRARLLLRENTQSRLSFIESDIDKMKEADIPGIFDLVSMRLVLPHLKKKHVVQSLIYKKLREDGLCILTTLTRKDDVLYTKNISDLAIKRSDLALFLKPFIAKRVKTIYFKTGNIFLEMFVCRKPGRT